MSGDTPEDPGIGADGPDPGDGSPDHIRGWISPDDRLWRHPSEVAAAKGVAARAAADPTRTRPSPWIVGGAAVCVAGALLASGLVLATSGASSDATGPSRATTESSLVVLTTPPTTEPGTANMAGLSQMNRMAVAARASLAALTVTRTSGVSMATGVIAEAGGIIATTIAAIAGAKAISFDQSDGSRTPAELVGSDVASGIAVLRVEPDLPVASFDNSDPTPGSTMVAMALHSGPGSTAAPRSSVYAGAVRSSGTAVGTGTPESAFAVTTANLPLSAQDSGCALLSAAGQVSGILDSTQTQGDTTVGVFLPAELVLGVTRQLVAAGTVEQGWLGVEASDIGGTTGATVTADSDVPGGATLDAVDAQGAAAQAGLQAGDVIVAVDGEPVHSTAELRTRLYADLPGTTVVIGVQRSGALQTASVVLAPYASDASDG
ncbi:MAG TPA: PDZ domain-containing protein [Acidimicrobiales bacterium]|nr:PDZ domain-containing protein [Acidimicrobiales bacterium]